MPDAPLLCGTCVGARTDFYVSRGQSVNLISGFSFAKPRKYQKASNSVPNGVVSPETDDPSKIDKSRFFENSHFGHKSALTFF